MVYCIVGAGVLLNILLRIRLTRERGFLPQRINKYTDLFLLSHVSWTEEEKEAVFKHVSFFVRQGRYPGKLDCENCILKANDALRRRDWLVIKYFVKNQINKRNVVLACKNH